MKTVNRPIHQFTPRNGAEGSEGAAEIIDLSNFVVSGQYQSCSQAHCGQKYKILLDRIFHLCYAGPKKDCEMNVPIKHRDSVFKRALAPNEPTKVLWTSPWVWVPWWNP
jgi:hypothetical protein